MLCHNLPPLTALPFITPSWGPWCWWRPTCRCPSGRWQPGGRSNASASCFSTASCSRTSAGSMSMRRESLTHVWQSGWQQKPDAFIIHECWSAFQAHRWKCMHFAVMYIRSKRASATRRGCWSRPSPHSSHPSSLASAKAGNSLWSSWLWALCWAFQLRFSARSALVSVHSLSLSVIYIFWCSALYITLCCCLKRCWPPSLLKSRLRTPKLELWQKRCSQPSGQCSPSVVRTERSRGVCTLCHIITQHEWACLHMHLHPDCSCHTKTGSNSLKRCGKYSVVSH